MSEYFNTYINTPEMDYWRKLCVAEGELLFFDKGAEFIVTGEVGRYIGYVKSGTLKYVVYSTDGREHIIGLEFENEFVTDFPFSLYGQKSRVSIIAVTPCEIYCVPTVMIAARMATDAGLKDVVMHSTVAVMSTIYDRYVALYCESPQERYENLLRRHPDLFARFSLKDIASFLNVTPIHLSRLRKSAVKGNG